MVGESSFFMLVCLIFYFIDEEDIDLFFFDFDKFFFVIARLVVIRQVLERKDSFIVVVMDVKVCYGVLERSCGICCQGEFQDFKVVIWLLDFGVKEKNLYRMVYDYFFLEVFLLEGYLLYFFLYVLEVIL